MPTTDEKLDELQACAEKLVALLKDRQPGLMTWHQFLYERVEELKKLLTTGRMRCGCLYSPDNDAPCEHLLAKSRRAVVQQLRRELGTGVVDAAVSIDEWLKAHPR